jgi:hypothetical protein
MKMVDRKNRKTALTASLYWPHLFSKHTVLPICLNRDSVLEFLQSWWWVHSSLSKISVSLECRWDSRATSRTGAVEGLEPIGSLGSLLLRLSAPESFTPSGTDPCQLIQRKIAAADTENTTLEYRIGCQNARYSVLADAPLSAGGLPRASQEQARREREGMQKRI